MIGSDDAMAVGQPCTDPEGHLARWQGGRPPHIVAGEAAITPGWSDRSGEVGCRHADRITRCQLHQLDPVAVWIGQPCRADRLPGAVGAVLHLDSMGHG